MTQMAFPPYADMTAPYADMTALDAVGPFDSGSSEKADSATQQRATAHMVPDAGEAQAAA